VLLAAPVAGNAAGQREQRLVHIRGHCVLVHDICTRQHLQACVLKQRTRQYSACLLVVCFCLSLYVQLLSSQQYPLAVAAQLSPAPPSLQCSSEWRPLDGQLQLTIDTLLGLMNTTSHCDATLQPTCSVCPSPGSSACRTAGQPSRSSATSGRSSKRLASAGGTVAATRWSWPAIATRTCTVYHGTCWAVQGHVQHDIISQSAVMNILFQTVCDGNCC
jgi:hypothetical protein